MYRQMSMESKQVRQTLKCQNGNKNCQSSLFCLPQRPLTISRYILRIQLSVEHVMHLPMHQPTFFEFAYSLHLSQLVVMLQAQELRAYLKGLGAEISAEKSPKGIEDDLHKIIGVCDTCFKDATEQEIESVLNGIVSMLVTVSIHSVMQSKPFLQVTLSSIFLMLQIPLERAENLVLAFCEKLTKAMGQNLKMVTLRV